MRALPKLLVHAIAKRRLRCSLGLRGSADKAYDTRGFVEECRKMIVTPHVAQKNNSAINGRTTNHEGYSLKRIEEVFGLKTIGCLRKVRFPGLRRVQWIFTLGSGL